MKLKLKGMTYIDLDKINQLKDLAKPISDADVLTDDIEEYNEINVISVHVINIKHHSESKDILKVSLRGASMTRGGYYNIEIEYEGKYESLLEEDSSLVKIFGLILNFIHSDILDIVEHEDDDVDNYMAFYVLIQKLKRRVIMKRKLRNRTMAIVDIFDRTCLIATDEDVDYTYTLVKPKPPKMPSETESERAARLDKMSIDLNIGDRTYKINPAFNFKAFINLNVNCIWADTENISLSKYNEIDTFEIGLCGNLYDDEFVLSSYENENGSYLFYKDKTKSDNIIQLASLYQENELVVSIQPKDFSNDSVEDLDKYENAIFSFKDDRISLKDSFIIGIPHPNKNYTEFIIVNENSSNVLIFRIERDDKELSFYYEIIDYDKTSVKDANISEHIFDMIKQGFRKYVMVNCTTPSMDRMRVIEESTDVNLIKYWNGDIIRT